MREMVIVHDRWHDRSGDWRMDRQLIAILAGRCDHAK